MNISELLPYFDNWTRSGNGKFHASCPMPNHDDSDPSVAITQDIETGKILIFCWGCNTKAPELMQAMGLPMSALQGDPGHSSAVRQNGQSTEVSEEDRIALEQRVKAAMGRLEEAEDYILERFNLSVEAGRALGLGVDNDFGAPYLIIPFYDPTGKLVGMQGRRLVDGEPRWRSVAGSGWSKMGCFGWSLEGPVVITEGPSDGLAVIGRANLPVISIRGASNTTSGVCEQLKDWLESVDPETGEITNRDAIIIGDPGEAGEKFATDLHEGTGIPFWIPSGGDLCEYLANGGNLDNTVSQVGASVTVPVKTASDERTELQDRIVDAWPNVIDDQDLINDLFNFKRREEGHYSQIFIDLRRNRHLLVGVGATDFDGAVRVINAQVQRAVPPHVGGGIGGGGGGGGLHAPIPDDYNPGDLPDIIWNIEDQLHVTEFSIKDAMDAYSEGEYYRSATGQYIKIVGDDLVNLKEAGVKSMLSSMAHWRIINGQRETGHVPADAARLITDPSWQCGLPEIKRRVEVPFMLADGQIISNLGYHDESGIYLLPRLGDVIVVPSVPAIVTDEHVAMAKKILEDVTEGFMFKDQASKTNLIAMTLTSPLRELFRSNPMVPLLTSTAPQSGSGKGTSIRVPLSTCGVGPYTLSTTAYNPDENEFEKKLVGKLLKKSTYIFLDNIRSTVSSSVMEQMLTAANYDGRTLGYSEVNSLSTLVMWVSTLQSTGAFNRDLTRRCVPVELIKNYRGKWKHKNIEAYLADKRGEMIWACFVVARKWMQDGAPISEARLDGYGGWTEVIGGILENVLEYEDFLGNLVSFRESQDENAMTIDGLLERWLSLYGSDAKPARMAIEDYEDPALHQMLNVHNPSTRQVLQALTRLLDSQRGYIINNTHVWEPLGMQPFGHEGLVKQYQCVPIPEEEDD